MQVEDYTHLLNSSECRRGRPLIEVFLALSRDGQRQYPSFCLFHWILNYLHHLKLSQAHNLVYWFKNTRAALRRSHLRETAATRLVFHKKKEDAELEAMITDQSIKLGCVHDYSRLFIEQCSILTVGRQYFLEPRRTMSQRV